MDTRLPAVAHRPERCAVLLLVVACAALAASKVTVTDTGWHLATARLAWETGRWPTANTFSWTHPDFPLYQQYPLYQSLLWAIRGAGGWVGLSVFGCVAWTAAFVLTLRWAGPLRQVAAWPLWWAVVLLTLRTRFVLRPDVLTMLLVLGILLACDLYRRRPWTAAVVLVGLQLAFVRTHQLFPLGLALQFAWLCHLLAVRHWPDRLLPGVALDRADGSLPLLPAAAAVAGSASACLTGPLGVRVLAVLPTTLGSLHHHRDHVNEFRRVWGAPADPVILACFGVLTCGLLLALHRSRCRLAPFDAVLGLLGVALAVAAIRGLPFLAVFAGGVVVRQRLRHPTVTDPLLRAAAALLACVLAVWMIDARTLHPARNLDLTQPGFGKARGNWPDDAVAFLRAHRPPGRVMNLTWYSGNALILAFGADLPVFVDPRFEAYPRRFLLDAIAAGADRSTFDRLVAGHRPDWLILEVRSAGTRRLAASLVAAERTGDRRWRLVHGDDQWLIFVAGEADGYFDSLPLPADPPDRLKPRFLDDPVLRAQQRRRWDDLTGAIGGP